MNKGLAPVVSEVPRSIISRIVEDKELVEELEKVLDPADSGFIHKRRVINRAIRMYKSYHYLRTFT